MDGKEMGIRFDDIFELVYIILYIVYNIYEYTKYSVDTYRIICYI